MALTGADCLGPDADLVLVFSGGNALGAFQAGVYEALHGAGLEPDWIIGTSIGAVNGALLAGSAPERRVERLREFWRTPFGAEGWWAFAPDMLRRASAAHWTAAAGRTGLFAPALSGPLLVGTPGPALYATDDLRRTLQASVDFNRLNGGPCRYSATAVDLETGEDAVFSSAERRIEADHVRASAALPVLFPPVEIGGRWFVDGGVSANLPLDPFFATPPTRPTLCVAVDLLPLAQALPRTVGEAASRMQDLLFAAQSRRSLARWRERYATHGSPGITLATLTYREQDNEIAGKALDFSAATVEGRWRKGREQAERLLHALRHGGLALPETGLVVHEI